MGILTPAYYKFFAELRKNNNKEWFDKNKPRYEADVKQPFLNLLEAVSQAVAPFEPDRPLADPKRMMFRINRDTRFSKDKSPYKEYLGAVISKFGSKDKIYPGHYLHLGHGECFVGGGAYWLGDRETLLKVRRYIVANEKAFKKSARGSTFVEAFGEIKGERNKRLLPEFAALSEKLPELYLTQMYWGVYVKPKETTGDDFVKFLAKKYKAAQGMTNFLRAAIYS